MKLLLLFTFTLLTSTLAYTQDLKVIDQNYDEALNLAAKEGKLVFVDFYTTWCGPCKKLDKLIFQNDSIRKEMARDFVLLKYDAENDSLYHLSKKHHVSSYPTGLILNARGRVVIRKYGFPGDGFKALSQNVSAFLEEGFKLNKANKILPGYAEKIDVTQYPKFYIDYVNRTNTKIDPVEFAEYWKVDQDVFSEGYFSTLLYFSSEEIPDAVADVLLENKEKYSALFSTNNVNIALMFLTFKKFQSAISNDSQADFTKAKEYAGKALSEDFAAQTISRYEAEFNESGKE
ncbi:thioredoxin family protein [Neolewinella persica]|uniref:thioredoxin family protein n=1 Tax=Neolewinella persica TaxID=70998 RepID=UPI000376B428|nr:thioredoxin family protein [Neolewinella persica]